MSFAPRSSALRRLLGLFQIGHQADERGVSSQEAIDEARAALSRRKFLGGVAAASAFAVTRKAFAAPRPPALDVGIVGAGLAGLQCAYQLKQLGLVASLYEASSRVGGRQFSLRGVFPGQNVERGGELIDTGHKTMLGWVNTLGLTREDLVKEPGDVFYYFDGQAIPEATVVDEYRAFVAAMRPDLQASTGAPTANAFNAADLALDNTTLADYLTSRGCGRWAKKAIEAAYLAEYGREANEQSSLNFLLFIHADRRSKFTPFGVSDERFHVVEGNDRIASGIAARLDKQPDFGMFLERVAKTSSGRIELTLRKGSQSIVRTHDKVVLAIPFTVLRNVVLDASLGLPPWKVKAIQELGYGDNAKMMIGFNGPVWAEQGSNGTSYSDLPNHQTTWETSPSTATTAHAVLTDYSSGARARRLDPTKVQTEADRFLTDLDRVYPGAKARATKIGGKYIAHLEHWPSNPLMRGAYTCYRPGQFTSIAGNEATAVGNLCFAGEHANSFYEWQGYMEGALLSGIDAASDVVA